MLVARPSLGKACLQHLACTSSAVLHALDAMAANFSVTVISCCQPWLLGRGCVRQIRSTKRVCER
eukprot:6206341-Pleurochrysis_carterae.AAC.7